MTEELTAPAMVPGEAAVASAQLSLDIARRRATLEQITADSHRFRGALQKRGWTIRLSDLELTSPGGDLRVGVQYVGGEFVAYVAGLPGEGRRRISLRITPALYARQPGCLDALVEVLRHIVDGDGFQVHEIASVAVGLESDGILFGERASDEPVDDGPADRGSSRPDPMAAEWEAGYQSDPADRPDMSGPGNPSGEGR